MARYAITILAITAIILAAGRAGAAGPAEPQELTVLAYNTHLFEDSAMECLCRCGHWPPFYDKCDWWDYAYEDEMRRDAIASRVEACGADIVVLQEVWCPVWQDWFINRLDANYPFAYSIDPNCRGNNAWPDYIKTCVFLCTAASEPWRGYTLGNGLVLLSKWPLSNVEFERFPTFEQCPITSACEVWADKGVLTADVDVGGVTIRVGGSHALGGQHDRGRWEWDLVASTITPFQLKDEAYIFAVDSDNKAHIVRMEDYGRWWDEKDQNYNYGAGWKHLWDGPAFAFDVVTSFELDGHPYLFRLSNTNHAYIYRINDDPYTGWTSMYDYEWYSTDVVAIESFELDGHPYLFTLDASDQAHITDINDDPSTGWTDTYDGPWLAGYAAITTFDVNGHPYIFTHDGDQGRIFRINDDPNTGWSPIYEGEPMSFIGYDTCTSFELDGHPYLFATHTNNNAYIHRINDDPCTGWTYVYGDPRDEYMKAWYRFEGDTTDTAGFDHGGTPYGDPTYSTDSRGETYAIQLDGVDDYVDVGDVNISGNSSRTIAGWVRATKPAGDIDGWTGIFGFTGPAVDNTHFEIQRRGHAEYYCIDVFGWAGNIIELDQEWHHLAATYDNSSNTIAWYADGSRVGSAARTLTNIIDNVQIGKRYDNNEYFPGLVDDVRIYSRALSQGEIAQLARSSTAVFEMNGHPYLFLEGNCCDQYIDCTLCRRRPGEAYLKRINDDPCTGWEDLLQLDDIRIIRDRTVVDEEGPPAIMMGDFNIHPDKYGIMNELFGKAGAVDAYIEVHGSDIGGETVDFLNNILEQYFCPGVSPDDDPDFCDPENHPPERIDYVYVRQSGAGVRLVPTEAEVFRDWKYDSPHYGKWIDLSDHYPVFVKFQLFEGGCTARAKGDLNCDRLINFADLAILSSAWNSNPGDVAWDPACDISDPNDDVIDEKDLDVIAQAWPTTPPVHNVTQGKWYEFIQTAITYASDGDEIKVAPGTYHEAINFKNRAIRLYSSGGPEVTTINGTGHYHVVKCVNGEGPSTVLEGFTITGGNANGPDSNEKCGGGMYNYKSSPTVTDCNFTGNTAQHAGGMFNDNGSSPKVTNCTFSSNSATTIFGGGMYNLNNSSPKVTNCTFSGNTADAGGGMHNRVNSDPNVTNCTFSNNSATGNGGGMDNYQSSPTVTNCILWGNTAPTDPQIHGGNPTVTYSDVQGGWTDEGNINADPCFVDADNPDPNLWNLRLKPDSNCIDAGNTAALPPDTTDLDDDDDTAEKIPFDLDGNNRVWNGIVDMGAYEYLDPPPPISSADNFKYLTMICADWLAGTKPEL
jgi:endonuclease/exonuclease/phosphatase family metal-dependent hydrolase